MVNFYSGFIVLGGERAVAEIGQTHPELRARHADEKDLLSAL